MDNTRTLPIYVDDTPPLNWKTTPRYKWPNAELERLVNDFDEERTVDTIRLVKHIEDLRKRGEESIVDLGLRGVEVNYDFGNDVARRQLVTTTRMVNECSEALLEAERQHRWALDNISTTRMSLCTHANNLFDNQGTTNWWRYQCLDCGKITSTMEEMRAKIPPGWGWGNGQWIV